MSTALVARIFRQAGVAPPLGLLVKTLARAPRPRLVRAVAWLALATDEPPAVLLRGTRFVIRGWDDYFAALQVPAGTKRADIEVPVPGAALVVRAARMGRGWQKEQLHAAGSVRPELALATAWLEDAVGCILHEDCALSPELGAACYRG